MRDLFDTVPTIKEYSVSEITKNIKGVLEKEFSYVKVKGEISNFKKSSYGHIYLSLKDENAVLSVVIFRQFAEYLNINLEDGLEVVVSGKITIYKDRSNYQLMAETVKVSGVGTLLKIIEQRKQKLSKEGLFDVSRKKELPEFIEKVGIITSATGAAVHDIMSRLKDRYPIEIVLYSTLVQGKDAPEQMIEAIEYFNKLSESEKPNVLIITRGGGSVEDLMCFNDESLVRVTANSDIPIISAVGHEIDYTLIDYASDLRLPTPTAVAEFIAELKENLKSQLDDILSQVAKIIFSKYETHKNCFEIFFKKLGSYSLLIKKNKSDFEFLNKMFFLNFKNCLRYKHNTYSEIASQLNFNRIFNTLEDRQNKLHILSERLKLFDYKEVLKRGYTVLKKTGKFIESINGVELGKEYILEFRDGERKVKIIN